MNRRISAALLAGSSAVFVAAALAGCGAEGDAAIAEPAVSFVTETATETVTETVTITETITETVTTEPPPPPGPKLEFGPGTWEVGVDVRPGKYKTQGPTNEVGCYWARLKDTSGDLGSILNNSILQGPGTVVINEGEYFKTNGCQTWVRSEP